MKFLGLFVWFSLSSLFVSGQDINYARKQVKILTSPEFHGRGYVKKGDQIAAQYLAAEFAKFNLKYFGSDYYQHYKFHVNTFPGATSVVIDGKKLSPGIDFLVYPPSSGANGHFGIETMDSTLFKPEFKVSDLFRTDFSDKFILLDTLGWNKDKMRNQVFDLLNFNQVKSAGVMLLSDKDLIHSVSQYSLQYCSLIVKRSSIGKKPQEIDVSIKSKEVDHKAVNIIGFIPGKVDSFLVVTAHYDHLGMMGKNTYFPGANDNASGSAMLLDFVRSYAGSSSPSKY